MPPKRPAAALGRVRDRRRGVVAGAGVAPGVLRRPAARGVPAEVEGEDSLVAKFEKGELVNPSLLSTLLWSRGLFVAFEGSYWQAAGSVAGEVVGYKDEEDFPVVELVAKGTNSERLLRWATGAPGVALRVHLCHGDCGGDPTADDLFHGRQVRIVKPEEKLPWMSSLEVVRHDELPELRGALAPKGDEKEAKKRRTSSSRSSKSRDRKRRKRKEKKKEKKEGREKSARREDAARGSKSGGKLLLKGQKELEAVFGGTGLDPSPAMRRRVRRKARKAARRSSKKSSSSSRSSSSSTEDSEVSQEGLFPETKKVKGMAKRSPGALSNQAVEEMKESLLTI